MVEKNAKLQTAEIALQAEKDRFTKLTQELEDALSSKATEVKALTKKAGNQIASVRSFDRVTRTFRL